MFNIVGRRGWWYLVSTILLVPGLVALLTGGLKPGIDFTGGTLLQVRLAAGTTQENVTAAARAAGFAEAVVQMAGESDALLRTRDIDIDEKADLMAALAEATGPVDELGFSAIGPVVGEELTRAAIIAVAVASGLILLYVTWAFRGMQHSVRYGVAAIVALLHDALFVIGVFAILGHALNVQIDALFVTALLTVIGFSVNDSIVVFDRIRETSRGYVHLDEHERPDVADTINYSANQSLTRSLNTSFTALLVLLALLLLGGPTVREFVLALSLGFAIGTYSSLFNAACVVVSWEERDLGRLWRRLRPWRRRSAA